MKDVSKVGNRGVIFTFDDDISVYLIHTDKYWFLCDTHLGPKSMEYIKEYIAMQANDAEIIVFNTHSDWDHIWGNCAFQDGMIIGHETCKTRMQEIGQFDLLRLPEYHQGNIDLVLPNLTFSERMSFAEADIEFIYAPGHTIDSSVCYDRQDSALFVGDLVEYPIPYLDFNDLETYMKTLDFINNFPARVKISSHSGIINNELIKQNFSYIMNIFKGNPVDPRVYRETPGVHNFNINNRLLLKYEIMVREKLGAKFDYTTFRKQFGDLKEVEYTDLQEALEFYYLHI